MELLSLDSISLAVGAAAGLVFGLLAAGLVAAGKIAKRDVSLAKAHTERDQARQQLKSEAELRSSVEANFSEAFHNLANDILHQQSGRFLEQNKRNLDGILNPLQERIREFQHTVQQSNQQSGERAASLSERLKQLEGLNLQMSREADKLTRALKGDSKTQGNWGEVVLERILEESGLRQGEDYYRQGSGMEVTDDSNRRVRPDVIVRLPEDKHLVIDSKVSLLAYERFAAGEQDRRSGHAKDLVRSIRSHVDGLGAKHYQAGGGLNSPDFVIMFMPIEAAFSIALNTDKALIQYAWDQKVMIVTPTTLMATLWTIASIWRQENQTRYALEIAKQSGQLYDKIAGFVETLQDIGKSMDKAREHYDKAMNQLSTGRGNVISRAERIRRMGARASKRLPPECVQETAEDEDEVSSVENETPSGQRN
ncbi:MAG: DNA recombination protein RmuC [Desulfohalobiaceae bacterium]|nr:DNA recombination protein RmuC [Desulfohalobiaceae bacterium]